MDGSKKALLLHEFNSVIAPQKAALSQRLPQLFQQYYEPPAELASTSLAAANGPAALAGSHQVKQHAAIKREGSVLQQQDSKRSKQHGAQGGALWEQQAAELWKEVGDIITKKLLSKKQAVPFKQPVDPIRDKVPDYFKIITNPMDLGTIKNKLSRREYASPLEVCEDVRLVWRNCHKFNPPGHPVCQYGEILSDIWEKEWATRHMEDRWNEIMLQKDPAAVPYKVAQLNSQLKSALLSVPAGQAAAAAAAAGEMSEVDKRRLSIQLGDLSGEQLATVLELIQTEMPLAANSEDEIELDMDALPHALLLKLRAHVDRLLAAQHGQQSAPSAWQQAAAGGAPVKQGAAAGHGSAAAAGGAGSRPPAPATSQQQSADGGGGEDESMHEPSSAGQASPGSTGADSPQEVKGSTADDPRARDGTAFVREAPRGPAGPGVDESATAPHTQSSILRDKQGRKTDLKVNADNWATLTSQPSMGEEGEAGEEAGEQDEMWVNFQSKAEQERQQAEEARKLKEQAEAEMLKKKQAEEEAARRAAEEEKERQRVLQEEEQRLAQEEQRARMEQCDKEVDEIKAHAGSANLVQAADMQGLLQSHAHALADDSGGLAAVGLMYKNDDEDVNFDDE